MSDLAAFEQLRRLAITAIFADDLLFELLSLKGGNALNLIHRLGSRSSLDLDFSMNGDFDDLADIERRIFAALERRFATVDVVVFDRKFERKPRVLGVDRQPGWGGYLISFKLIEALQAARLRSRPAKMQIESLTIGDGQARVFRIEISKNEYVQGSVEHDLDHFAIRVYTPAMIAIEKLRALCQQLPEYEVERTPRARARDFYDIYVIVAQGGVNLKAEESTELLVPMFEAKAVPLRLLDQLSDQREFHRPDWPDVMTHVSEALEPFDFYFDFVIDQIERLKPLWNK